MRKGCWILVLLFALLLGGATLAYLYGLHPQVVLWILNQTWERTESLEAQVEGQLQVLGFPVVGAGRLRFLKPDLYDLDLNSLRVIAGPEALWVVVPALKSALRVTAKGMTPSQILADVVSGWEAADPAGWVRNVTAQPGEVRLFAPEVVNGHRCWVLEWPARTGERIGGTLYISQRWRAPLRFDQMDSARQVIRTFTVRELRRNPGLQPADFDYHPLPGWHTLDFPYTPGMRISLEDLLAASGDVGQGLGRLEAQILQRAPELEEWLRRHGLRP